MELRENKRTKGLTVKLFESEYKALKEVARADGVNMTDFLRRCIIQRQRELSRGLA